jgi:hypothetical protein
MMTLQNIPNIPIHRTFKATDDIVNGAKSLQHMDIFEQTCSTIQACNIQHQLTIY